jgi:1,4-alpha-glucan branching enzyme
MRRLLHIASIIFTALSTNVHAQILDVSPAFPTVDDVVTIIYDASEGNGALSGVGTVYAHTGVITSQSTSPTNWLHVQGTWGTADASVQMTNLGGNLHQITIDIDAFYGFPSTTQVQKLAFVFRNATGTSVGREVDGSDIFYDIYPTNAGFLAKLFSPTSSQVVDLGDAINIVGKSNQNAQLTLKDNGNVLATVSNLNEINHTLNVTNPGEHTIEFTASNGSQTITDSITYIVNPAITYINPPAGTKNGINRLSDTSAIIQLYAPEKNNIYLLGDFNNWTPSISNHMNLSLDSTTWWIQLTNLTPNTTFGYQFFIDGSLKLADPLSERIADPNNDQSIGAITYPNPYAYPTGETTGFISLFETNPTPFNWQHDNYTRPAKSELMVYELLVRDFVAARNYLTLIDTLDYLDSLGINAIELMPVGEFENNESWGYNPSFHMALDKYYGTPEHFKQFVDACHSRGIAVILDIALNHTFGQSPMVNMYWDAVNQRPATNNPWFNAICPHPPYCWGYDLNHEKQATKEYIDRVNRFWLEEYHLDGFRFDYTKGFVNSAAGYSNTRIDILKRMVDTIWNFNPEAYIILEHWADNNEEKQLAEYGMLLWGNLTYDYHQAMKGYSSNFSNGIHTSRGWSVPHLVTYVESHDEERGMFECLTAGNSTNTSHNVKVPNIALLRAQAAAVTMITTPGPKMIWQFGELGYDISIDVPCRTCNKPILWNYWQNVNRRQLYEVYKATLNLRTSQPVFKEGTFSYSLTSPIKKMIYTHPSMDVLVLSNFNVQASQAFAGFTTTGWWYEYFTGDSINVSNVNMQLTLDPAEYRIYTTTKLSQPEITSTVSLEALVDESLPINIFPNPTESQLSITFPTDGISRATIRVVDLSGSVVSQKVVTKEEISKSTVVLDVSALKSGNYCVLVETDKGYSNGNFVKH